ncbi:MAG: FtsX-like permease family protein, partial [Micrococcales bacterium]|nr:FtsX-like permease family protein [Micrococcales bacterium]
GSGGTRIPLVAGMRALAPVAAQGLPPVGGSEAALLSAPTAALHRIRSGLPDSAGRVPAGMDRLRDGAIPIVASRDLGRRVGETLRLGDRRAVVVGTAPEDAGLGPTQRWVLMDARFTGRVVRSPSRPTLVLVGAAAEDAIAVAARFRAALPRAAIVTDAGSGYRALRETPSVASLSVMLTAASALAAALSILAAVLAVLAAARVRDRSVAVLRVLGMSRAQLRRALAIELVPVAVAVLAAGTGLGIGLAALVLGAIDLRPFSGGATLPGLTLAPLPLAAVLGGFLLLAGGATAAAARASTRLTPADVIRADS